jgi:Fe2+ or Zn2+ uptake regulation protein
MISMASLSERATQAITSYTARDEMRENLRENQEARNAESSRENRNFVQIYPKGWSRLRTLISDNPTAAKVYAILAEHIDTKFGAVTVSQELLAELTGVSVRTIARATKYLEDSNALVRIKVSGGLYSYALNPHEIWRSWDKHKDYAAFRTRTMVSKKDQDGIIRQRLSMMMREQAGEPELPFDDAEIT